ncbi:hypothetical protein TNIN_165051 [Trichonephila inaurata madagascariensis]|uniref:Uncharacterized protein n=1 Tax=Trichonephila inaurata madagascariensis TaxID=2747483 RepID=A0A8X7CAR3_9ARAC|nr:hypothetical protein TNIN_165051 [Trichonephila inaurata madagascariensis]
MQKRKLKNNHLKHMAPKKMEKNRLKKYKTNDEFKEKPEKNIPLKIAREKDPLYKPTPVSKRSRRQETFQASDDMDTDTNLSDTGYVTYLASEECESLLEADFNQVAANPLTGPLLPSSPKK